jgi:hypothetical protein
VNFTIATRTLPENLPILVSDAAVVVGLVAAGIGLLLTRRVVLIAAGFLLGIWPFAMLRIWRSAELRGASTWGLLTLPVLAVSAALVLVAAFLLTDTGRWLGYLPPRGDAVLTLVPIGAFTCVALAGVGSIIPASGTDFGTLRFSDLTVWLLSGGLALLVLFTRSMLRGAILAGWTSGAASVLAQTIWLRYYSGFSLPPVMNAQVLLSGMTFLVLITASVLTLRESARKRL